MKVDEADLREREDGERKFWGRADGEERVKCVFWMGLEKIFEETWAQPTTKKPTVGIDPLQLNVGVDEPEGRVDCGQCGRS